MPNGGKKTDYILHKHRCLFRLNIHLEWGKIFANNIDGKVLVFKTYKQVLKLNSKK